MPTLTRFFVKTSLIYLVAGMLIAAANASQSLLDWPPLLVALRPVYIHFLIVGWCAQMIFGVMYWMFPKFTKEKPRGSERLGWSAYILLNTGLLLRAIGEPLLAVEPTMNAGWLLLLSAIFQCTAAWCVMVNTWPRVKER